MKIPAILFLAAILLTIPTTVLASIRNEVYAKSSGGDSSVNVEVNNEVNTGSSYTSTTTTGTTNVEIHQTGTGTSTVRVNGKEWKVEGPGDISVSEGSNGKMTPTSTPVPQISATPTVTPTATVTPTDAPGEPHDEQLVMLETFKQNMEKMKETLEYLFSSIFGGQ